MDFNIKAGHDCSEYIKFHSDATVNVIIKGISYKVDKYICRSCGKLLFRDFLTKKRVTFNNGCGIEVDKGII